MGVSDQEQFPLGPRIETEDWRTVFVLRRLKVPKGLVTTLRESGHLSRFGPTVPGLEWVPGTHTESKSSGVKGVGVFP